MGGTVMRAMFSLSAMMLVVGCGGASSKTAPATSASSDSTDGDPPECKINGFDVAAAALGGAAAGANGGRNTALDAIEQRCERAREVQRWNAQHQREVAALRADIERDKRRAELENQRLAAATAEGQMMGRCIADDATACRAACAGGKAVACTLHGYQLWNGTGIAQDRDEGLGFFAIGCERGDKNGCEAVARVKAALQRQMPAAAAAPVASPPASQRVFLFGGKDHKTFLGCFCGADAPDSLENDSGRFGKRGFNMEGPTLWTVIGPFRSSFDELSACNRFATNPPVIVREDGTFLARLTRNSTLPGAVRNEAVLKWLDEEVCEGR